jgi:prepilin-type N-terminal cleavage/methylation domain-containing protein
MSEHRNERGYTLSEILIVVALFSIMAALSLPSLQEIRRQTEVDMVSRRLGEVLIRCRALAILHRCTTGVVFEHEPFTGWSCRLAEDGDGDGILRRDLRSGRDRYLGEVVDLELGNAGLGILPGLRIPDPSGRGWLDDQRDDPVRAGVGDIISFTPQGTARPCSIYLTDHHRRMRVLRVIGSTGRIRTLEWQEHWLHWKRVGT